MKKYCFGIDIGGTTVKCGLFETDGTLLEKWEIRTHSEDNGSRILPDVGETILAKMAEKNIDKSEVAGAGVGVPGPVRRHRPLPLRIYRYFSLPSLPGLSRRHPEGYGLRCHPNVYGFPIFQEECHPSQTDRI